MRKSSAIVSFILFGPSLLVAQLSIYDSRIEPPPHFFTWGDVYTEVGVWGSAHAEINGGFLSSVTVRDRATATITAGKLGSLEAREDASLLVLGVEGDRIATRDRATVDLYGAKQSALGQVLAGGTGGLRIYGGQYGFVSTWPGLGGRVEVYGGRISTLSSLSGLMGMHGGEADRLDAGSEAGVSVLDSGTIHTIMSADGEGTLVIAGGDPAPDIRLFENARLIVLHTGGVEPNHVTYRLTDFEGAGASTSFARREFSLLLDNNYKSLVISAWSDTTQAGHKIWRGQVELVRVGDDIRALALGGGWMMMGFVAPATEVLQMELSQNLVSWQPWKAAFPGDGNTHAHVVKTGSEQTLFFRLRKWPKPGP